MNISDEELLKEYEKACQQFVELMHYRRRIEIELELRGIHVNRKNKKEHTTKQD